MVEKKDILEYLVPEHYLAEKLEKNFECLLISVQNNTSETQTLKLFDVTNGFSASSSADNPFTFISNGLSDYVELITDIATNPIKIVNIKYICENTAQLSNILKPYLVSPFGKLERKNIQPRKFVSALNKQETIVDIPLFDSPLYVDNKNYIEVLVNGNERVDFLVHYKQIYKHQIFINEILKDEGAELRCHSCSIYTVNRFKREVAKARARRDKAKRSKKLSKPSLLKIFKQ